MMWKTALLLFCYLFVSLSCSPIYPSIRFGQRDTSILLTSSMQAPLRLMGGAGSPSLEPVELRSGRHADAVFTNRYRKVLGQISARKFLQSIMGKRLRNENVGFVKRRRSGVYKRTYEGGRSTFHRQAYRVQQKISNATKPASHTHTKSCIILVLL